MNGECWRRAYRFSSRWEAGKMEPGAESLLTLRGRGLEMEGGVSLERLGPEKAAAALRGELGPELELDDVPARCAMVLYDTAVGMGGEYARLMALQALGLPSGRRGEEALQKALRLCNDARTASAMCHLRRARYCELVNHHPFLRARLRGWLRRVDALEEAVR